MLLCRPLLIFSFVPLASCKRKSLALGFAPGFDPVLGHCLGSTKPGLSAPRHLLGVTEKERRLKAGALLYWCYCHDEYDVDLHVLDDKGSM